MAKSRVVLLRRLIIRRRSAEWWYPHNHHDASIRPSNLFYSRSLTTSFSSILFQTKINPGGRAIPPPPASSSSSSLLWRLGQLRHARFTGADVRPGNVIERKGKIYQVIKAQHTTQGRGGAIIQVELRDVDSGNKVNERLRTDEAIERVYVQEKSFNYLYTDDDVIVLVEPDTYTQINVPKELFGDSLPFLQEDMTVKLQMYDNQPMSASIPTKVTCTVAEAQVPVKGSSVTPQYKKVKLENGLTVQVPGHVLAGEKIIINTSDLSYVSRA
ncbi:OLC1v1007720C1 [Oldenlandia corymbosa var. corymbosa]|uniref:OLC1v1007720C1 n=1 Tax=Oldenlandia corymbosa var. corymbosa TaxID=529605 RepID=A0AAV1DMG6_OLDCO|nr:OLC1v1007720C1 [Oldenlandia corymbosa var. corymbosa]